MNWRSAEGYPAPGTPLEQWAWEFLRRNPQYRADWREYQSLCDALRKRYGTKIGADREPTAFAAWDLRDAEAIVYDPPRLNGESEEAWITRVGKSAEPLAFGRWVSKKWGIGCAIPPDPELSPFHAQRGNPYWLASNSMTKFVSYLEPAKVRGAEV